MKPAAASFGAHRSCVSARPLAPCRYTMTGCAPVPRGRNTATRCVFPSGRSTRNQRAFGATMPSGAGAARTRNPCTDAGGSSPIVVLVVDAVDAVVGDTVDAVVVALLPLSPLLEHPTTTSDMITAVAAIARTAPALRISELLLRHEGRGDRRLRVEPRPRKLGASEVPRRELRRRQHFLCGPSRAGEERRHIRRGKLEFEALPSERD